MSTPVEFAAKCRRLGPNLAQAEREGVGAAALLVKTAVQAEGLQGRLRGVGRRGAKIGVRYDIKGIRNPAALVRATGPAHLLENPTKPHPIGPRRRGRGARGKRAVLVNGQPVARVNQHPGTRGKKPWAKGVAKATPQVPKAYQAAVGRALTRSFRG